MPISANIANLASQFEKKIVQDESFKPEPPVNSTGSSVAERQAQLTAAMERDQPDQFIATPQSKLQRERVNTPNMKTRGEQAFMENSKAPDNLKQEIERQAFAAERLKGLVNQAESVSAGMSNPISKPSGLAKSKTSSSSAYFSLPRSVQGELPTSPPLLPVPKSPSLKGLGISFGPSTTTPQPTTPLKGLAISLGPSPETISPIRSIETWRSNIQPDVPAE